MKSRVSNFQHLVTLTLAGILCILPARVVAETITGKVVSLEKNNRSFVLQSDNESASKEQQITVVLYQLKNNNGKKTHWPACIHKGNTVILEGKYSPATKSFLATAITGGNLMHRHDPTGVRKRLHRCQKNMDTCKK